MLAKTGNALSALFCNSLYTTLLAIHGINLVFSQWVSFPVAHLDPASIILLACAANALFSSADLKFDWDHWEH